MIITVKELGLELRPYSKGPCWQLYEWTTGRTDRRGNPLPDEWLPLEYYPTTVERGFELMAERACRRSGVRGDIRSAISEMRSIRHAIARAVGEALNEP